MLHAVVDLKGWSRGTYPFVVAVMNPNTAYLMSMTIRRWVGNQWKTHLPDSWFEGPGGVVLLSCLVTAVFWVILWWMYRRRIFLRL